MILLKLPPRGPHESAQIDDRAHGQNIQAKSLDFFFLYEKNVSKMPGKLSHLDRFVQPLYFTEE